MTTRVIKQQVVLPHTVTQSIIIAGVTSVLPAQLSPSAQVITALVIAGAGGGAVSSVNAKTGVVVLVPSDIGAEVAGAAATAQANAIATASADATTKANAALASAVAADAALIVDSIADADTSHAPSRNAVFDALAGKETAGAASAAIAAHVAAADPHTGYALESTIGAAGGIASLDGSGKVPSAQLPAYVDDVLEFANFAALPGTGTAGIIYVTLDTNFEYRWSGSAYIQLVSSPGTTDALAEGSTNLYFTAARVRSAVLTGLSLATNQAIAATDTVLQAFGYIQKQITDLIATVAGKQASNAKLTDIAGLTLTASTLRVLRENTAGTNLELATVATTANTRLYEKNGLFEYCGQAPVGSATSASVWTIRRQEYTSAGAYVSTKQAVAVKWDDRLTATYT